MALQFPAYYGLTPPGGKPFYVVLLADGDDLSIVTNRSGDWARGDAELLANVLMPEQELEDWDVELVSPSKVPDGWQNLDKAFDPNQPRDEGGRWSGGEAYHGTSSKLLSSILKDGITLGKVKSLFEGSPYLEDERGRSVYLTKREDIAFFSYGKDRARASGGRAVVLRVQVPPEAAPQFKIDEFEIDSVRIPNTIPPSWIVGAFEWKNDKWTEVNLARYRKTTGLSLFAVVIEDVATQKYDPNQPRDEAGQWARTGMVFVGDRDQLPPHIASLRIPPAWTDVQIATDPDADLLVVGKDSKGRDQYVYSDRHAARQAAAKFERVSEINARWDELTSENRANMDSDNAVTQAHAEVTALIMETGLRPGSERDTGADQQAYGATTLEGRHVVRNGTVLRFVGKKGVSLEIPVDNPELAAMLRTRARQAGRAGQLFPDVSQTSLAQYVHSLGEDAGFKTKDLRTALGTRTARELVETTRAPTSASAYRAAVRSVARSVSAVLGNTPTVALQSYIDPTVFGGWRAAAGV